MSAGDQAAQESKTDRYAEHAPFVPLLGVPVLELLKPEPGECILDVVCGYGVLSRKILEAGATVVGVDGSPDMVEAARQRGIAAHLADAFHLSFEAEFDAAFSNAALHWMRLSPDAVFKGVRRSLKPGGRFAGELGGHGNVAAVMVALLAVLRRYGVGEPASMSPWYFPTAGEYTEKLRPAGFGVNSIGLFPRSTSFGTTCGAGLRPSRGHFFGLFHNLDETKLLRKLLSCSVRPSATPRASGQLITSACDF